MHKLNRFASFDETGDLDALVADGLPEYPADGDLSALTDDHVGQIHDALVESVATLAADPNFDPADAERVVAQVTSLRDEAARRMAAEPSGTGDAGTGDAGDAGGTGDAGTGDITPADREAALARLASLIEAGSGDAGGTATGDGGETIALSQSPGLDADGVAAAVSAGVTAVVPAIIEAFASANPPAPAPGRGHAADLGRFRPDSMAPRPDAGQAPARRGRLLVASDVAGHAMSSELQSMDDVVAVMRERHRGLGRASGVSDEKVVVATFAMSDGDIPEGRDLRGLNNEADRGEIKRRLRMALGKDAIGIDPWTGEAKPIGRGGIAVGNPDALVASGGLAAPVEPYYPQLHVGQAAMPTFDAIPGFVAERGGIRLVSPASLNSLATATVVGQFTDGVADSSTTFTSATADFTDADLNQPIIASGVLPAGTIITAIGSTTSVTISQNATNSNTGVTFRLPSRNPNNLGPAVGLVTAAQDAAGPPNTVKFTYDVPDGNQIEHDVYSVYTSLQFANLTARTFPEQVELNILLANDLAARIAEQAALDYITDWSTLLTASKTFGTARQLLAQLEHQAAYLRNSLRMDPAAVVRLGLPAWAINAMRGDYISSFIGGGDNWGLSDDELMSWFQERALLPFFYQDGPSDISQLFPVVGSGAINQGSNNATPVALPDYPGTGSGGTFRTQVVSFMWPEGTWLGLTTGELNIGLVRDSILNSQNRFRNFEEKWVTPAFVGSIGSSLRTVHTVAADGSYGAAATVVLGAGSGL